MFELLALLPKSLAISEGTWAEDVAVAAFVFLVGWQQVHTLAGALV